MPRTFRFLRGTPWVFLLVLLVASPARPAGFNIFEQGAKATAMGGAFSAVADDPSAIFYNPAGLGFQDHFSAMAGVTLITFTRGRFEGADPVPGVGVREDYHKTWFNPGQVFINAPVTSNIKFGLGVFTAFGLASRWKNAEQYSGRFIDQNTNIKTFSVEPVIAWHALPSLSIAAGAEYRLSNLAFEQNQAANNPFTQAQVDVAHVRIESDNDSSWGYNVGVLWKPIPSLSLGASYRSKMTIDYTGRAHFTQRPTGNPVFDALVASELPDHQPRVKTKVNFPAIASFGAAYSCPSQEFTLSADAVWFQWSRFSAIDINFPDQEVPNLHRNAGWSDSWQYRVGVEKKFHALALRAGFVYDQTPQPDFDVGPILPDSNRHGYSIGIGYSTDRWGVDFADLYLPFSPRNTHGKNQDGYNGTYNIVANLIGLSFRLSF